MKEQLINYETAVLAKEKGFNINQRSRWIEIMSDKSVFVRHILNPDREAVINRSAPNRIQDPESHHKVGSIFISNVHEVTEGRQAGHYKNHGEAPNQSLLQKWLRDEYGINIEIECMKIHDPDYALYIYSRYGRKQYYGSESESRFETYEEALEVGLKEALKLI